MPQPRTHESAPSPLAFFGLLAACLILAPACKTAAEGNGEVPAESGTDAGSSTVDAASLPDGGGSGEVSGSADGSPFTTLATSYFIGSPDSAATTVVFAFSKPVSCADLATPGWDRRITDATQLLEIKFFGKDPGMFTAVTTVTPAPGEASVNYTLSSTSATPNEVGANGGTTTLTSLVPGASASGGFALAFGANSLKGTFNAVFCPGGQEP